MTGTTKGKREICGSLYRDPDSDVGYMCGKNKGHYGTHRFIKTWTKSNMPITSGDRGN